MEEREQLVRWELESDRPAAMLYAEDSDDITALVFKFGGDVVRMDVERVWFWRGMPERVYGPEGKFKQDEEPFMLLNEGRTFRVLVPPAHTL